MRKPLDENEVKNFVGPTGVGRPAFDLEIYGAPSFVVGRAGSLSVSSSPEFRNSNQEPALEKRQGRGTLRPGIVR